MTQLSDADLARLIDWAREVYLSDADWSMQDESLLGRLEKRERLARYQSKLSGGHQAPLTNS